MTINQDVYIEGATPLWVFENLQYLFDPDFKNHYSIRVMRMPDGMLKIRAARMVRQKPGG